MCDCDFGKGVRTCHCAGCHETFTSVEAFDRHQAMTAEGVRCFDPAALRRQDGSQMLVRDGLSGFWRRNRPGRVPDPKWQREKAVVGGVCGCDVCTGTMQDGLAAA